MLPASGFALALRTLMRRPLPAALAVASLALGIGANTAVFPAAPERLISVFTGWQKGPSYGQVSYAGFRDVREQTRTLAGAAAQLYIPVSVETAAGPKVELAFLVSANYFDLLGLRPAVGRFFLPTDDRALGGEPVAVLSHAFWRREFGSDPGVVGRVNHFNRTPLTVGGVAPEGFTCTCSGLVPGVWAPLTMAKQMMPFDFDEGAVLVAGGAGGAVAGVRQPGEVVAGAGGGAGEGDRATVGAGGEPGSGAAATAATLLFGLAPAMHAARADLASALKEQPQALRRALNYDPGFEPRHGLAAPLNLASGQYDEARGQAFYRDLVQ